MGLEPSRPFISQVPGPDVVVPPPVRELAGLDAVRPVWRNELGGLTFELTGPLGARRFVKWNPRGNGIDLQAEVSRLIWAVEYMPVPRVLDVGGDAAADWLVTTGMPGRSAVDERWRADPATAVTAIGRGLRAMHDALPTACCPFSWTDEDRRAAPRRRAQVDKDAPTPTERARWHPEHGHLSWDDALAVLADAPPPDRLVVCHGDACAPNTLVGEDGRWSAHVDLGRLGVADRWADLSVAAWSTEWNYGPGWTPALLAAYGVESDGDRLAWYRLLWDLS